MPNIPEQTIAKQTICRHTPSNRLRSMSPGKVAAPVDAVNGPDARVARLVGFPDEKHVAT
jgi:hypothetical protein